MSTPYHRTGPRHAARAIRRRHWLTLERQFGIPLLVATIGCAIPYGEHDPHTLTLLPWEWVLTGVFAIAAIVLAIDLVRDRPGLHLGFVTTGAAWTAYTIYQAIITESTVLDSIGLALASAGMAILALVAWRALHAQDARKAARHG